ncbi:MAG: hypothetical protein HW394_1449, partial [Acidobacteria bacterium]|nr:hypothetical protein [Acidobacteriota bacterium]
MSGRWIVGGLVGAMLVGATPLEAQFPRLLGPLPEDGLRVAPFFDGWYANPDGTIDLSFGYSNLNKEPVEIPLGPDNFIVPKEYDGRQPTSFPVVVPPPPGGGAPGAGATAGATASAGAAGGTG